MKKSTIPSFILASALSACSFNYSGSAKLDANGFSSTSEAEGRTRKQRLRHRKGGEVRVISDVRAGVTIVLDRPSPAEPLQAFMTPAEKSPLRNENSTIKDYELDERHYPWTELLLDEKNWKLLNPSEGFAVIFDCREMIADNAISCIGKIGELPIKKEEYSGLGIQALNELQLSQDAGAVGEVVGSQAEENAGETKTNLASE
ncbi:MAG: hypothetical protein OEY44_03165 [Candidatus Peregrinibacteria bacterium]|nr:hypothetical protein [Candidatus Peregrinibacteria bacterium]